MSEVERLRLEWDKHEALCDIWGDDSLTKEQADSKFRTLLQSWGYRNADTATPVYVGAYIQSRVINQLRDFMADVTDITALQKELDHLKSSGIVEVPARNPNVMEYMKHWESRAKTAEDKLSTVRAETIEQVVDACERMKTVFRSDQYATPQPLGSIQECMAIDACLEVIRNLGDE